jgi:hypothetical protein
VFLLKKWEFFKTKTMLNKIFSQTQPDTFNTPEMVKFGLMFKELQKVEN